MWSLDDILSALDAPVGGIDLEPNEVTLRLFDETTRMGIGLNSLGFGVLILPGQRDSLAFRTNFALYDPWSNLRIQNLSIDLKDVSVLQCSFAIANENSTSTLAALFRAILELQAKYDESGSAIWQMKELFNRGFSSVVDREIITGLLGELVVLKADKDPNLLCDSWHSDPLDIYDFSSGGVRVEVKSSTSRFRHHRLTSGQFPKRGDFDLFLASVLVHQVEQGTSFLDFFIEVCGNLNSENRLKLDRVALSTLHVPPSLIKDYFFDLHATIASLKFFSSETIPTVLTLPGIISCEWLADLEQLPPLIEGVFASNLLCTKN